MTICFVVENEFYGSEQDARNAIVATHPELLDDDMPDYFDNHIEEVESGN